MYIKINPDSQQKCLSQGAFLAQSPQKKYRIILLFTIAYLHLKLIKTYFTFKALSTTLNVIRVCLHNLSIITFLNPRECLPPTSLEQEKVSS